MEAASTAIGGLRVALQVISNHKRPVLEVYELLRNVQDPPQEMPIMVGDRAVGTTAHRFSNIFIDFTVVNVGGVSAENVVLEFVGDAADIVGRKVPSILAPGTIHRLPPGGSRYLLQLYGNSAIMTSENFEIRFGYDGPDNGLNRIARAWFRFRESPQYEGVYTFNASSYRDAILPHPEYL